MAPPTKKRKLSEPKSNADLADVAQDFFRKHFESQFAPLPEAQSTRQQRTCQEEETAEKSTSEDEWSGIDSQDDEEDKEQVEVVDYSSVDYYHLNGEGRMEKKERRAFMVLFLSYLLFFILLTFSFCTPYYQEKRYTNMTQKSPLVLRPRPTIIPSQYNRHHHPRKNPHSPKIPPPY